MLSLAISATMEMASEFDESAASTIEALVDHRHGLAAAPRSTAASLNAQCVASALLDTLGLCTARGYRNIALAREFRRVACLGWRTAFSVGGLVQAMSEYRVDEIWKARNDLLLSRMPYILLYATGI
jgi:hypothetical protein